MKIYVKVNYKALIDASNEMKNAQIDHTMSVTYSEKYGTYAVFNIYNDVMTACNIMSKCGVETSRKEK